MNTVKAAELMKKYCGHVGAAQNMDCLSEEDVHNGEVLGHIHWMCNEILTCTVDDDKANRWIGFMQGVLASRFQVPLEEFRELNKEAGGENHGLAEVRAEAIEYFIGYALKETSKSLPASKSNKWTYYEAACSDISVLASRYVNKVRSVK